MIKSFKDDVYGTYFEVHDDFVTMCKSIRGSMDPLDEIEIPTKQGFAVTYMYDDSEGRILVWFLLDFIILDSELDSDLAALIAHEALHVVDKVCDVTGIEDTEARAYYLQFVVRKVLSIWEDGVTCSLIQ